MARSAMDATRFTATGPYAHSKPNTASTLQFAGPPPPNETPQQKVIRLREGARKAKLARISKFDRVVATGRVVADAAHRTTAYGLIFLTGAAGLVTVFSLGDMIVYNRRKKREFFAEQQAKHAKELGMARIAAAEGSADENQILLLNRERAAEEAEVAKQNRKGFFKSTLQYLYGNPEQQKEAEQNAAKTPSELVEGLREEVHEKTGNLGIMKAVEESRKEQPSSKGGPLDELADNAASSTAASTKGWTSWITGR
ncbi:uncharacterized protein BDZ99DRAFT_409985 [Mytilinidion resinicola]|uniref:Uncharacterized protein n=1 Tax=Mytilinidion resinicola TaxID=574789 RepID=A0A6A6YYF9_9PEZI|nr:uncharacterized protein BDZ99DRAFT_409985 [Mytilinidion resinicola]KAF2813861.1 hypothetical protein BDZ99DRAFT_409985 [Mytilinidion resinicola]